MSKFTKKVGRLVSNIGARVVNVVSQTSVPPEARSHSQPIK